METNSLPNTFELIPKPSSMIQSLRSVGYSLETSLADLIDNSITAQASQIDIFFDIDENDVSVALLDNGYGMSLDELQMAMTWGSKDPSLSREKNDLGRFGLGLKTASFAQCKRLTVITRKNGETNGAYWDLDHVKKTNKWQIICLLPEDFHKVYKFHELTNNGTLVIWQKTDKILNLEYNESKDDVYEKFKHTEKHLALIFHRFLLSKINKQTINLTINGRKINPVDPFAHNHPATQIHPQETLKYNKYKIKIQAFTLPHHSKCTTTEYEKNAIDGYDSSQGFYIFRNNRLLLYGTWFKLIRKKDIFKLSRVAIDLPNHIDNDWNIDIKKASAVPPTIIKQQLKVYIETFVEGSKRVYNGKGHRKSHITSPVWEMITDKNIKRFEINTKHYLIEHLFNSLNNNQKHELSFILKMIGECLPLDAIFSIYGSNPNDFETNIDNKELEEKVISIFKPDSSNMDLLLPILKSTEPFNHYSGNWETFLKSR